MSMQIGIPKPAIPKGVSRAKELFQRGKSKAKEAKGRAKERREERREAKGRGSKTKVHRTENELFVVHHNHLHQ